MNLKTNPAHRFHALLDAGDPRALARQCTAKSKQAGRRCRNAARKGKTVCGFHGVKRENTPTRRTIERRANSSRINAAREVLMEEIENGELHPDALRVFRETYAQRVHLSLYAVFILHLNQFLNGHLDRRVWLQVLSRYVS